MLMLVYAISDNIQWVLGDGLGVVGEVGVWTTQFYIATHAFLKFDMATSCLNAMSGA